MINNHENFFYLVKVTYIRKPARPFFKPTTNFQLVASEISIICTILFKNRFQKVKNQLDICWNTVEIKNLKLLNTSKWTFQISLPVPKISIGFSWYLIILVLPWKILHLILDKNLMISSNRVFCFQKRKLLGAPTHKDFIFPENFEVFSLAWTIILRKIFCFVWLWIYKRDGKTLLLEACWN